MKLLFSCSNALLKWLKLELPRIPSPDGRKVGTQTIRSDADTLAWQCHVIENFLHSGRYTVIAVEANSRYTLLLPYTDPPTQDALANELIRQWGNQSLDLMLDQGALQESSVPQVTEQFIQLPKSCAWFKNTDLSVNGHVSDAEQWVRDTLDQYQISALDEESAFGIGLHINRQFKKARIDGNKQRFFPIPRLIDDALRRYVIPNRPEPTRTATTGKVVSLQDYRKRS